MSLINALSIACIAVCITAVSAYFAIGCPEQEIRVVNAGPHLTGAPAPAIPWAEVPAGAGAQMEAPK